MRKKRSLMISFSDVRAAAALPSDVKPSFVKLGYSFGDEAMPQA
jgi:hypothetical protein